MNKQIFLIFLVLLALPITSALSLPQWNVALQNDFVGQSGNVLIQQQTFENEHCNRYQNFIVPNEFELWYPSVANYVTGNIDGNNLTVNAVNTSILDYIDGEIFVNGNNLKLHTFAGDVSTCLNPSNQTSNIMFYKNFFTNPNSTGAYVFKSNLTMANDATNYNLSDSVVFIMDTFSNYYNNYNITNYNFQCTFIDNKTIMLNATLNNNNTWIINLNQTLINNNTNICLWNVTQINNNNNTCIMQPTIYANSTCNPTTYLNVSSVNICNGTAYYNISNNINNSYLIDLLLNATNIFAFNQTLNYSFSCTPRTENYFNWSFGNQTEFNYSYFMNNNMTLSGFNCPANTCTCNSPACPACPAPIVNVTIPVTNEGTMINIPQGGIYLIGAGIILLGLIIGGIMLYKKSEEPVKKERATAPIEAKKELSEFDKEMR